MWASSQWGLPPRLKIQQHILTFHSGLGQRIMRQQSNSKDIVGNYHDWKMEAATGNLAHVRSFHAQVPCGPTHAAQRHCHDGRCLGSDVSDMKMLKSIFHVLHVCVWEGHCDLRNSHVLHKRLYRAWGHPGPGVSRPPHPVQPWKDDTSEKPGEIWIKSEV